MLLNARIVDGMATLSRKEGKHREAIKYYEESLKIGKKINDKDIEKHIFKGIGESYLELNELDKAELNFEKSLTICKEIKFKIK